VIHSPQVKKPFEWNQEKNQILKTQRGITFEDVVTAIEEQRVLNCINHPNPKKYPHQKLLIIEIDGYAYLIPYVEDERKIFFKTIIPSRKATQHYLIDKK